MANKKKKVVIYHGNCTARDGFSGAWAAWKKFKDAALYIGATDRVHPPDNLRGKEVYFIDWVYPLETMQKVKDIAAKVVAIDHHESVVDSTKAMDDHLYDTAHSGAVLAWQYFHPTKRVPKLLEYVEDYDLWKYELKDTAAVSAYLQSIPSTFQMWNRLARDFEKVETRKKYIDKGNAILAFQDRLVEEVAERAELVEFFGYKVLAVNSPVFSDQLGNVLAKKHPPFAIVWRETKGEIRVSLRSEAGFDTTQFAVKFGGGGHPQSSGFAVPVDGPLPWKPVKK